VSERRSDIEIACDLIMLRRHVPSLPPIVAKLIDEATVSLVQHWADDLIRVVIGKPMPPIDPNILGANIVPFGKRPA